MQLVIQPGGVVRCVYGEAIDLEALGRLTVERASHVEPDADGPVARRSRSRRRSRARAVSAAKRGGGRRSRLATYALARCRLALSRRLLPSF